MPVCGMNKWYGPGRARDYVTLKEIDWTVGGKDSDHQITVPFAFEFESSVPSYLHWLVSPDNPDFLLSACIHDYLLEEKNYEPLAAAAEWHSAAKKSGVPFWKRVPMFVFIALFTLR